MAATTLGLVGLGNLGREFGKRAVAASKTVVAYDALPGASLDGAARAASVADLVAAGARTVVSVVPDDAAAMDVSARLLAAAPADGGLLHVSSSTISPAAARKLAAEHAAAGVAYVAAPIFARPENMRAGQASFAVAGASAAARARAFADALAVAAPAERVFDFGDAAEAANVAKLCGNYLIAASIEALAESLALAEGHGVDRGDVLDMLTATIFDCAIYNGYGGRVASRDHAPGGFAIHHGLKDVRLVRDAADAAGVPMPLGSLLVDQFRSAANDPRLAGRDWSALGLHVSRNAGVDATGEADA